MFPIDLETFTFSIQIPSRFADSACCTFLFELKTVNTFSLSMHYGAAVKLDQKWPTLTNNFSMDFDHRVPKFGIQLPQLPNFPNKYKC